jgi:hypothetical protein
MKLHVVGIDLGKTVFHLVGLDSTGKVVIRKRCSRTQLLVFTANLQVQLIGMEACSGAHFLGRALREQGHEARLMPAQYVKPYVQTRAGCPRWCKRSWQRVFPSANSRYWPLLQCEAVPPSQGDTTPPTRRLFPCNFSAYLGRRVPLADTHFLRHAELLNLITR